MVRRYINPKRLVVDPDRIRRELLELENLEGVSSEDLKGNYNFGLLMWARKFLKHDFDVQGRIERIRKRAKEVSKSKKRKFKNEELREKVVQLLDGLENQTPSYPVLIRQYGRVFAHARRSLKKDFEVITRIVNLRRKSQEVSSKLKLESRKKKLEFELDELEKHSVISYEDLMKSYGKKFIWVKAFSEDSELKERVERLQRESLKVSYRRIAGEGICASDLVLKYSHLERAARVLHGCRNGKPYLQLLAEETGVPYANKTRAKGFTKDKKAREILEDLSSKDRFPGSCRVTRTTMTLSRSNAIRHRSYLGKRFGIALEPGYEQVGSVVIVYLGSRITNRYATMFEFSGKNSNAAGTEFYMELEKKLEFLKRD
ncbi:hypothetical protein J4429_01695 [Candidatus Pacearchaeota archaeon]|nr:hypothetical protein [Candidatus Pacearchaeota archaeon]